MTTLMFDSFVVMREDMMCCVENAVLEVVATLVVAVDLACYFVRRRDVATHTFETFVSSSLGVCARSSLTFVQTAYYSLGYVSTDSNQA